MLRESKYELIIGDVNVTLPEKARERPFNLIIADPPFGIKFNKSSHEYGAEEYDLYQDEFTPELYFEFSKKWIETCYSALVDNGSMYIISGWTNLRPILNAVDKSKFQTLNHAIWQFSWGVFTKKRFVTSHYHILLLVKDKKRYQFYKQSKFDEDTFFWPKYNRGNDPHRIKGHPCQLPVILLEKLICTSSLPCDLVGDVFSGSGGTILAARLNNRDVIGFEIRKEYEVIIHEKARFGKPVSSFFKQTTLESYLSD